MRREPDDFEGQELALVYVAKKLKEAVRLEEVLTGAGFDYLVETGYLPRRRGVCVRAGRCVFLRGSGRRSGGSRGDAARGV